MAGAERHLVGRFEDEPASYPFLDFRRDLQYAFDQLPEP